MSLLSVAALLYLAVPGSIVAFSCYAYLVAHVAAQKISTYALVNPLIALALGTLVLGEPITRASVISAALVLPGVALVLLQRGAPASSGPVRAQDALRPS